MSKILEVNHLKVSFRTSGGTLKAVRDISFDLERGKTLAIVGESVTSKAILGILAGNSIVEGGEILYDGKDLLKISEEEMCKIRGDRISMIFQDPLSSLNPIVKIGKQITEAMLLKNKTNRLSAKKDFADMLSLLKENMISAMGEAKKAEIEASVETFDTFSTEALKWENSYNTAHSAAQALISDMEDYLFLTEKKQKLDAKSRLREMAKNVAQIKDVFLTRKYDESLASLAERLKQASSAVTDATAEMLREGKTLLAEIIAQPQPDFFCIGYYKIQNPEADIVSMDVQELNEMTRSYLSEKFMTAFLSDAEKGTAYSFHESLEKKKDVLRKLAETRAYFAAELTDHADALKIARAAADAVDASIDRLEIQKDSTAYTFRTSIIGATEKYFAAKVKNPKEEARFEHQSKKREALIARGKTVDWKVVPKLVFDLTELQEEILKVID